MRKEYDLHGAKRGAVVKDPGKQRITIMLDGDVLSAFRDRAAGTGRGYQTSSTRRCATTSRTASSKTRYAG